MSKTSIFAFGVAIVIAIAVLVIYTCAYTVKEHEQAVILAFGEVVGEPISEPGLHFKNPLFEARMFDKRWLAWDGDPNQITTLDKRYILIDVFARWKIVDPLIFIEKLRDEQSAQGRLDDILDSATRNVIANHNLIEAIRSTNRRFKISKEERENLLSTYSDKEEDFSKDLPLADDADELMEVDSDILADTDTDAINSDVLDTDADATDTDVAQPTEPVVAQTDLSKKSDTNVKSDKKDDSKSQKESQLPNIYEIEQGRQKLTELIIQKASQKARELGIELKDVRLKRIDYIPSVQQSVFERMTSERHKVAARLRSQGDGLSAKIIGRKERDLKKIRSVAYRRAEEIKGNADAAAARIYAGAYKRDPQLYKFLKTLESYRNTLGEKTWLLITTDSEYGTYLKSSK